MRKCKVKCQKDPIYSIFLKRRLFKDVFWVSHSFTRSSCYHPLLFITFCPYRERREMWYWDKWLGGSWEVWWIGGLALSQEYKCPPHAIFWLQYLGLHFVKWTRHANPRLGGGNANIFGSLEVKNGFWAWPEFASAENQACHQNQRMDPSDKRTRIWSTMLVFIWSEFGLVSRILQNPRKKGAQILLVHFLSSTRFKISPSQSEIPTLDIPLLTSKPDAISMVIWTIYMPLKSGIESD